jgi:type I restriction-modification system DNA methylase subunit
MTEQNFDTAFARVGELVADFKQHEKDYLSSSYSEQDVRKDFIDKFWMALGWDVNHEAQKNPNEQEVKVERGVGVEGRIKKADYAFLTPNFRDVRFFVEAKKPARNIDNADDYFQTIRYGWNAQTPVSVLTDFEQFRVVDCRLKPDVKTALDRGIPKLKFHYTDYADPEKFAEIYYLFSREAAHAGKLEQFAATMPKPTGKAANRRLFAEAYKAVDEEFLRELDEMRGDLARSFKLRNPKMNGEELTEATQRTLDRLVFMRFLEDKLIEPEPMVEKFGDGGSAWGDFIAQSERLNRIYNGIIFKPHFIDESDFVVDEKVFASVRERLAHTNTVYNFNYIPIHVLGSIYERFLGNVIIATDKRATVAPKPEVRKAGGVYYTPEYIVRYIVAETVGKLIDGKKPTEIAEMRFADIACGSGSFLLGIFDELLRYHTAYYNRTKTNRAEGLRAGCVENADGTLRLSLRQKKAILTRNIYGVDLDAQAVEVAQLSLFLRLLEDETTASAKGHQLEFRETMLPDLRANIKHGNSLIGWDIGGGLFGDEEERKLYPMDFKQAFPEVMNRGGFDAIVGNPPYIRIQTLQETTPLSVEYFKKNYAAASKGNYDIYVVFIERALQLLNGSGRLGYIVPHKFFNSQYGAPIRKVLSEGRHLSHVVHFGDAQVFEGATTYTALVFADKTEREEMRFVRAKDLSAWQDGHAGDEGMIATPRITSEEWNFTIGDGAGLFEKLSAMPTKLGNIATRMFQGVITSADTVYLFKEFEVQNNVTEVYSQELEDRVTLETQILKPVVRSGSIKRYTAEPTVYVLFPYEVQNNSARLFSADEMRDTFPLAWDYLRRNKNLLESREKGKFKDAQWYRFGRSQNLGMWEQSKLMIPYMITELAAYPDEESNFYFVNVTTGGYGITIADTDLSLHYLCGLLNSTLLDSYLKQVSTNFRGGYFAANKQYIEQLPIRTINFSDKADRARHDRMVSLVEAMLNAKRQLQTARTDRDRDHYEAKCAALDRQIDELVYELYALTPAEIALVEGKDA